MGLPHFVFFDELQDGSSPTNPKNEPEHLNPMSNCGHSGTSCQGNPYKISRSGYGNLDSFIFPVYYLTTVMENTRIHDIVQRFHHIP